MSVTLPSDPHVLDLRREFTYGTWPITEITTGRTVMAVGAEVHADGWHLRCGTWSPDEYPAVAITAPDRRTVVLVQMSPGGIVGDWGTLWNMVPVPLYWSDLTDTGGVEPEVDDPWAVVARVHRAALGENPAAVAKHLNVRDAARTNLAWAVLDRRHAVGWREHRVSPRDAHLFDQAGMLPSDWPEWRFEKDGYSGFGPRYEDPADVAALFTTGMPAAAAADWLQCTTWWLPQRLTFIAAGWTPQQADALADALANHPGDMDVLVREQEAWVDLAETEPPTFLLAAARLGLTSAEAADPALDRDAILVMDALR